MTDLDDLKDALQSPPDFVAHSLDLDAIMTAGARRRRARRLAVSGATGLAVVVVLVGGGWFAGRNDPTAPGIVPPAAAPASATASPLPTDAPARGAIGTVVATGLKAKQGAWVVYAVAVAEPGLPRTHFGIMLGRRLPDGSFTSDVMANEVGGSDMAKGFHALQGAMNVNGENTLAFGYYVGPATRITASAGGKTIAAGHAAWSNDPSVVMFWFDPAKTHGAKLTKLAAFDRNGQKLYAKNTGFGVG